MSLAGDLSHAYDREDALRAQVKFLTEQRDNAVLLIERINDHDCACFRCREAIKRFHKNLEKP